MKTRTHNFLKSNSDNSGKYVCLECNVDAGKIEPGEKSPGVWRGNATVYHCEAKTHVFGARYWGEAHHYNSIHGNCWKCGRSLGCGLCCGIEKEVLCQNFREHGGLGAVWGTKRAFLEHGPMVLQRHGPRQTLADYPREWAQEYEPLEVPENARGFLSELIAKLTKKVSE